VAGTAGPPSTSPSTRSSQTTARKSFARMGQSWPHPRKRERCRRVRQDRRGNDDESCPPCPPNPDFRLCPRPPGLRGRLPRGRGVWRFGPRGRHDGRSGPPGLTTLRQDPLRVSPGGSGSNRDRGVPLPSAPVPPSSLSDLLAESSLARHRAFS
jgi:hypothetical protein